MRSLLLAATALILSGTPATAADLHLAPASPWQVDAAPDLCRLSRDYAAGDERITLRLEQFRPSSFVQAVVITDHVVRAESLARFKVRLGRTPPFRSAAFPLILPDGRKAMQLNFAFAKPTDASAWTWPADATLAAIDEIEFAAPVMGTLVFQTRTLANAMVEMRKCGEDMIRGWGFDPAEQAALSRQVEPIGATYKWLRFEDFKDLPPAPGQLDHLVLRINVDTAGKPTACHVARSYSDPAVAARSCPAVMQRARFTPALDAAGKPVASFWMQRATHF